MEVKPWIVRAAEFLNLHPILRLIDQTHARDESHVSMLLVVLLSGKGRLRLFPHRMRPHWSTMRRILRIGVPSGVEGVLTWGAQFVILFIQN